LNTGIARIKLGRALARQGRSREGETELLAGLRIITPQSSPGAQWLRQAREELVAVYQALGQPTEAAHYLAQLADTNPSLAR